MIQDWRRAGESSDHSDGRAADAEHLLVMTIPVAPKDFFGIVLELHLQKLPELRIAGFDLLLRCETMIRKIIAAGVPDPQIDQASKRASSVPQADRVVSHVQVEDYAGERFASPSKEAFVITLNQSNRSVDDIGPLFAKPDSGFLEEARI